MNEMTNQIPGDQVGEEQQYEIKIDPIKQRRFAWYVIVPLLVLCSPVVSLACMAIVSNVIQDFSNVRHNGLRNVLVMFIVVSFFLAMGGLLIVLFVTPLLASNDLRIWMRNTPKQTARGYASAPLLPSIALLILGVVVCVLGVILSVLDAIPREDFGKMGMFGGTMIAIGIVLYCVIWPYTKWLTKRFRRLFSRRLLCFNCGYDLRGNLESTNCPECGLEVPRLIPELQQDPTGAES